MNSLKIYNVNYIDYNNRDDIMIYQSKGKVKSEKMFPIYGDYIFKPLSKTKPLTTPLFAYSEVFWSYFIKKYFEEDAPRYFLAKCINIDKNIPKYYPIGTLVKKVIVPNQKLVNLLDYFNNHPEECIDISKYINFCEKVYDYTGIINSPIFEKRKDLRNQLENQILLSILKEDENFHYENVSFIEENGKPIKLCPTLDSEFSSFFLYPDQKEKRENRKMVHQNYLNIPFSIDTSTEKGIFEIIKYDIRISLNNVTTILTKDTDVVITFIEKLDQLIEEIENLDTLLENNDFFNTLNSDSWKIGHARYKNNDEASAVYLEKNIPEIKLDINQFNNNLKKECLESFKNLKFQLQILLYLYQNGCSLKYPTIKEAFDMKKINITEEEYNNLSNDEKLKLICTKEKIRKKR